MDSFTTSNRPDAEGFRNEVYFNPRPMSRIRPRTPANATKDVSTIVRLSATVISPMLARLRRHKIFHFGNACHQRLILLTVVWAVRSIRRGAGDEIRAVVQKGA